MNHSLEFEMEQEQYAKEVQKKRGLSLPTVRTQERRETMIVCREKRVLSNSMDVAKLLKGILSKQDPVSRDKEHFWTIHLNARHRVKFVELISVGCLTSSIVHPREVFRRAVKSGSAAVILGHNHPSGDVTPSQEDIGLTERLTQAGSLIGIRVLDHVIIGSRGFQSLMEGG